MLEVLIPTSQPAVAVPDGTIVFKILTATVTRAYKLETFSASGTVKFPGSSAIALPGTLNTVVTTTITIPANVTEMVIKVNPIGGALNSHLRQGDLTSSVITEVVNWSGCTVSNLRLRGALQLVSVPDTLPASITDCHQMFSYCRKFNGPVNNWDMSKVTNLYQMFSDCDIFNQPVDTWDVSKVTNFNYVFSACKLFDQPLNSWNTISATMMYGVLSGATVFNQPLNLWKTSKVTNMAQLVAFTTKFNQNLSGWNVSAVTTYITFDQSATAWQAINKPKFK